MDKKIVQSLKRRAEGYNRFETTKEYVVDDGKKRLTRVKEVKKYYPPEQTALRMLLELDSPSGDALSQMTDEELRAEKQRLIRLLDD